MITWLGKHKDLVVTKWGWKSQSNRLSPVMMDTKPAPESLLKIIHCNCSTGCKTLRCSCRKHGLDCTIFCGLCQDDICDNMAQVSVSDDDDENNF